MFFRKVRLTPYEISTALKSFPASHRGPEFAGIAKYSCAESINSKQLKIRCFKTSDGTALSLTLYALWLRVLYVTEPASNKVRHSEIRPMWGLEFRNGGEEPFPHM